MCNLKSALMVVFTSQKPANNELRFFLFWTTGLPAGHWRELVLKMGTFDSVSLKKRQQNPSQESMNTHEYTGQALIGKRNEEGEASTLVDGIFMIIPLRSGRDSWHDVIYVYGLVKNIRVRQGTFHTF